MERSSAGAGGIAALAIAASLTAQVQWRRVDSAGAGALADEQIAYDSHRQVVVLFGGLALPTQTPYHLAEWDGTQWSSPRNVGPLPPGRTGHGMAFDSARNRMVVFGGVCIGACPGGTGTQALDSTWEYDGNWTLRTLAHRPSPRWGVAMAFDRARQRTVMFGGRDVAQPFLAETWEYDGVDWRQHDPENVPLAGGPMAYDVMSRTVVLVAGGQTFAWNGIDWQQVAAAGTPQFANAMVWDDARACLVLYSPGYTTAWEWTGGFWAQRAAIAPVPDVSFAMAYDQGHAQVVWISTLDLGTPTFRDTWVYEPVAPASFQPFGSRCTSSASAPDLHAHLGTRPWIGAPFRIDVTDVALDSPGVLLILAANVVQPVDLELFGWPGCLQYVAIERVESMTMAGGAARWVVAIPDDANLIGAVFHAQAVAFDLLANGGAVVSNAATGVVGER